jgi:catalytic LigB subunit of aromatic ring-opening dioxygenase
MSFDRPDDQSAYVAAGRLDQTVHRRRTLNMARITVSLYTSNIPAVGAGFDLGKTKEDYWKPLFAGYDFAKEWERTHKPDVIFLVYNDHATALSLQMIPTFAIMTGPEFNPADEGYGARPVPKVIGDPELASYIASEVIHQDFDLTMVNEIDVDHGLTVPLSCVFGEVDAWPCKIIPLLPSRSCSIPCLRARVVSRSARRSARRSGATPRISTCRSGAPAA